MTKKINIIDNRRRRVFYCGEICEFNFSLMNFFPHDVSDISFEIKIFSDSDSKLQVLWSRIKKFPALGVFIKDIEAAFDTAELKTGKYSVNCAVLHNDEILAEENYTVSIVQPGRETVKLWHWPATVHYNAIEADEVSAKKEIDLLSDIGYTWAQIRSAWLLDNPGKAIKIIEYAMEKGIELGVLIDNAGGGVFIADRDTPEDARLLNHKGEVTGYVCAQHPKVQDNHRILLERIMAIIRDFPSCATVFMNSEVEDKLKLPCNPQARKMHIDALGFDPAKTVKNIDPVYSDSMTDYTGIAEGVISDDDPQYRYALYYFKSGDGFTPVNTLMGEVIHKYRPDITVITDPLRLCSLYGRFNGADAACSWTYTNPDPKATLFVETLKSCARHDKKKIIHTITLWNYAGTLVPSGKDRFAREQTLRMEPDRFSENAWINFSRGVDAIGTYFGSPIEPFLEDGDPFIYSPETVKAIKTFADDIIARFGNFALKLRDVPRRTAVLDSFSSRVYGVSPRPYNHYPCYAVYDMYTVLQMAHIPADILWDETIAEDGLGMYDVLVLPVCDTLTETVYKKIIQFSKGGGIVIADQYLRAKIPGAIRLDFDFTYRKRVNANANTTGKDFAVKDDTAFKKEWKEEICTGVTAEEDQAILEQYASALRTKLKDVYSLDCECSSPRVLLNMREAGGVRYLFAVNDHRVYGERTGKYKSMLEKGMPENAVFTLNNLTSIPEVYELTEGKKVPFEIKTGDDNTYTISFSLTIPAASGLIIAIYNKKFKPMKIVHSEHAVRGKSVQMEIHTGTDEGMQPIRVDLLRPDGSGHEMSGWYTAERGICSVCWVPAVNDEAGIWKLQAEDITTKQTATSVISVS